MKPLQKVQAKELPSLTPTILKAPAEPVVFHEQIHPKRPQLRRRASEFKSKRSRMILYFPVRAISGFETGDSFFDSGGNECAPMALMFSADLERVGDVR